MAYWMYLLLTFTVSNQCNHYQNRFSSYSPSPGIGQLNRCWISCLKPFVYLYSEKFLIFNLLSNLFNLIVSDELILETCHVLIRYLFFH